MNWAENSRPTREKLLVAARASAHFEEERQRRLTVLGLIRRAFEWREPGQPPLASEGEFLDEAYGDQKTYWESWRDATEADDLLAHFLAVHFASERCARDWKAFDKFGINPTVLLRRKEKEAKEALARAPTGRLLSGFDVVSSPETGDKAFCGAVQCGERRARRRRLGVRLQRRAAEFPARKI